MKVLILRPGEQKPLCETPGILWIHGGGYVTGMAEMIYFSRAKNLVRRYGAVVITPEYRLAGKAPYPAALMDCYAALLYLKNHSEELGFDDSRIMVGGESAGGGLAAALCLYARDRGEVNIAFQMPLYPMIDDRETESSRDNHAPVWNSKRNKKAWAKYLRDVGEDVPPYAAPARAEDLCGLPPAYTFVGDIEPFYCETLTYVNRLNEAGAAAKADVYQGCFHAFDMLLPMKKVSKRAIARFEEEYLYAARHYRAPQTKKHPR
ncbi:MAG: alpha/beta hydrolase [Clostridiales bacterium]|nr:alpha/beta hydrolase [Clostridiales bacterium]